MLGRVATAASTKVQVSHLEQDFLRTKAGEGKAVDLEAASMSAGQRRKTSRREQDPEGSSQLSQGITWAPDTT